MNEETRKLYCSLLVDKIVDMYGADRKLVEDWVPKSAIQELIDECPEYVDHVALQEWASDVYNEMLNNQRQDLLRDEMVD